MDLPRRIQPKISSCLKLFCVEAHSAGGMLLFRSFAESIQVAQNCAKIKKIWLKFFAFIRVFPPKSKETLAVVALCPSNHRAGALLEKYPTFT
jgi:hypothetical protein